MAIARAIGILEYRGTQANLETPPLVLVERIPWSRGMLVAGRRTAAHIRQKPFSARRQVSVTSGIEAAQAFAGDASPAMTTNCAIKMNGLA